MACNFLFLLMHVSIMTTWSLHDKPVATIPFSLNGRGGSVSVYYGRNDDPVRAGFDAIPRLNFDINLCRGFPAMHAKINEYSGSGYRMLCGWIQIVTNEYFESHDEKKGKKSFSVDVAPSMRDLGLPFASVGFPPGFFDAPCYNIGDHAKLRWVANTFLTTVPMRSREEKISWLAGFRWGYVEYDKPEQKPTSLLPLEVTSANAWNSCLPFLRKECKGWRFRRA